MFGEIEAAQRLVEAVGLIGGIVVFVVVAASVSLVLYVRSSGARSMSEGKAEENDTTAHRTIAETVQTFTAEVVAQSNAKDQRLDAQQSRIDTLAEAVTRLTVESAETKARYEADTAARERERQDLIDSRGRLEGKVDVLTRENGVLSAQMDSMKLRQTKTESELDKYRAQHEKAERENNLLKLTVDQLQIERGALQTRVNDQQKQITELLAEVSHLKAELRAFYEAEAVLVEGADGMIVKKRDTGKLTSPEAAAE